MALQMRKVKEIPASSQQLYGHSANIINNNNTAPKQNTKEDTKSNFLLRRSSRIDCHHGVERKIHSNVTTPTNNISATTTTASTITRNRLYLDRSALKCKDSVICSSNVSACIHNHNNMTDNQQICHEDNGEDYIGWHSSLASDGDCCDDSVNLDLDIASNKSRMEKSNSVKRGKRSLSSTRVAKSNEKNIKRKTASDSAQQVKFSGKVDDVSEKEINPSADGGKSDHHMSLRLRKR